MTYYQDITEARADITGHRKAPMVTFINEAYEILTYHSENYSIMLDRIDLKVNHSPIEAHNHTLASLNMLVDRVTYLARLFSRIERIRASLAMAEAEHGYILTIPHKNELIRYINDNVIDTFIKKSGNELVRKLSVGLISFKV